MTAMTSGPASLRDAVTRSPLHPFTPWPAPSARTRLYRVHADWSATPAPRGMRPKLPVVVRRLARDGDVVGMRLAEPAAGDAHEARVGAQLLDGAAAAVAHPGAEPAHELVDGVGDGTLVRHPPLDPLRHELPAIGLLEVAV